MKITLAAILCMSFAIGNAQTAAPVDQADAAANTALQTTQTYMDKNPTKATPKLKQWHKDTLTAQFAYRRCIAGLGHADTCMTNSGLAITLAGMKTALANAKKKPAAKH